MPANTAPIFALTPNVGANNVLLSTALTNTKAFDGTDVAGTAKALVYTAGANGSRLEYVRVKYSSTNGAAASGTTAATLVRLWLNNGSADTTATNNQFIGEIAIAAATVTALGTSELSEYSKTFNINIPAGYKLYAGTTVAVGGTACALAVSAVGGDY